MKIDKKTFRRENVLMGVGVLITLATTATVLGDVILGFNSNVSLADLEFVTASLLAAGASWAGIGSWHRVKRNEQRGEDTGPFHEYIDPFGEPRYDNPNPQE